MAWKVLEVIFGSGDFYIDTEGPEPENRQRLCVDGTSYEVDDKIVAFINGPLWERFQGPADNV